ncbi:AlpA family phage regulatory protein [Nordella sp. HKS 07]|uniref:helix-turn-helix transcriptional regulator n=1 Tax=Nordella sp. HKS 07 TaxID=2712222 RepID=UPI0013E1F2FC|nr:AlpA family phage regulatory protein [Nordella sp. HKS 07]
MSAGDHAFLRLPQVLKAIGVSASTLWRWEQSGLFPRRRKLGPNIVGWHQSEITEWVRSRDMAQSPSASVRIS